MTTPAESQRITIPTPVGRAIILGLSIAIVLGAIFWWDFPPKQFALTPGEVSRVRINAPRQITFESASKTRDAQDKAASAVADVYDPPDLQIGRQQLARAQSILNFLDSIRHDTYTTFTQKQVQVAQIS